MKITFKYNITKMGWYAALFSFCFGLLQVVVYYIYPNEVSLNFGIYHLAPSIIIHLILLMAVIIHAFILKKATIEHLRSIGFILLNIPAAYGCFVLVLLRTY